MLTFRDRNRLRRVQARFSQQCTISEPFRASMRYAHHRTGCALLASLTCQRQ